MNKFWIAAAMIAAPAAIVSAQTMTAPTYVMKAGAGDMYEIQSSKLVLMTTTNPDLKTFANQMITDHTQSTADVKAAAMQGHVKVAPPKLDAMKARNIAALKAAKGTARDTLYISQQKTAHAEALALHSGYADNGTVEPLKMAAAKITPVVQHHIDMLNMM